MNQSKLHISLLGGLAIRTQETAVTQFASRKVEALLVYLACNLRPHPRETLAAMLWPENDQNRALANLSVALSSLRKQLATAVIAERHTIAFNTEIDWALDTAVFQQAISQAREDQKRRGKLSRSSAAVLATAVSLYNGDFLAGFNIRYAPEFEAWALLEQERLRQQFLTALADLVAFHQQRHRLDKAIAYGQQLLAVDPLQENIHRQLMRLYAQDNQRSAALAQYEQCVRILNEELGVEPDEATVALYKEIADGQGSRGSGEILPSHPIAPSPLHNLPASANAFIGRADELAHIEQWLAEANGRLLTIIAPGGMGKTRLAQEAARAQVGQFADGVWMVSLVAYHETSEVITAVAQTISLTLSGKDAPATQLLNHLQNCEMLLVLDNLEHLLTPSLLAFIAQLSEHAPDLRLIATSRERLRLQAETVLDLLGLPYPDSFQSPISDYPAVQLFINRAQRVQASFKIEGQETAVTQLCQLVGGLPLALELMATWTRVLMVTEIVAEIQRGLGSLSATLHDVPRRHRSLLAVIKTSWQMLAAEEQSLFRKLAVFRGGFTRVAAVQVAAATLPQLMSLVDRSFLRLDSDQRFRRHPLLLQFAQEQLAAQPDEQAQVQAAHAHFFADFVQSHEPALQGAGAPQALAAMAADLENSRAAWQWGLTQMDAAALDKLVVGIARFFADSSRYLEGAEFFENSLKQVQAQPITAKMQVQLGRFWHENGRFAEAETILLEALPVTEQPNLNQTRIACLKQLGIVVDDQGRRTEARDYLEEARQLCQTEGNADQMMPILNALGNICISVGDYDQARAYLDETMQLAVAAGNTLRIAILHNSLGIVANRQTDYRQAIHQWQLARDAFVQLNHNAGWANASFNMAMAYAGLEEYDAALKNIQAAFAAHEKLGNKRGMAGGQAVMGSIYRKLGQRRKARGYYYDSLLLAQEVGVNWVAIGALVEVAELEMSYGELKRAALLLAFAVQHPAIEANTLENAQKLLAELRAELPEGIIAEVETAVLSHTLDSVIDDLVNGRSLVK